MELIFTVALLLFTIAAVCLYSVRNVTYWKNKGVKYFTPVPFFGSYAKVYLMQTNICKLATDVYWKYPNERVVGLFRLSTPELLVRDPDIVKHVLLNDFGFFHYRRFFPIHEGEAEPLFRNLFNMEGDSWRLLRHRLTPAFTSGKLKAMFPLIVERAERLHERILAAGGAPLDVRDLMSRFTIDFIGACGFGLDMNTLNEENSAFRVLGKAVFELPPLDLLKMFLKQVFPKASKNLRMASRYENDVMSLVRTVLKQRNYEPSGRGDFVDLLLEIQKKGAMQGESMVKFKADGTPEQVSFEITEELLAAQVFVFFSAGFETSSFSTSVLLHQLAYHPYEQKKIQEEIDQVLAKYGNKLCYDAVSKMNYLECAFKEGMRMLPSVGFLSRECARKYKFPDMDLTIDKGVKIIIPVQAMQNDPQYYENPEEFRPERFDAEKFNQEKTKHVFLPFGDGPRSCIGARLGLMQSMAGLAAVLSKFSFEPAPKTTRKLHVEPSASVTQVVTDIPLIFRERKRIEC